MKNKSELKTILMVICLVLILLLLLVIFSLYKLVFVKHDKKIKKVVASEIIKEYKIDDIEDLFFDFRNANVKYVLSNKTELVIKQSGKTNKMFFKKTEYNNSVHIKEQVTNAFVKTSYIVYIPETYYGNITIINGFGNINIGNFVNEINVDNNSGTVTVGDVNKINIKTVSGNINIDSVDTSLTLTSSTGDIFVKSLRGNTNIDTITGEVLIKKLMILGDSYIESTSGDISINVEKNSICKLKIDSDNPTNSISKNVCKYKKNVLKIKDVTGIVTIK